MATKKSSLNPRESVRVSRRQVHTPSFNEQSSFEDHVLSTLAEQDRLLEKIGTGTEQLRQSQIDTGKKVDAIHAAIYDPESGLYGRVKEHGKVITKTSRGLTWFIGVLIAAGMTGIGKVLYDFMAGHIHFTP